MVRQLERSEVQDLHQGDTVEQEVHALEQAPLTVPEEWMREHGTAAPERRRPIRWLRWLGAAVILSAAAGVALVATTGGDDAVAQPQRTSRPIARTVDRWELGLTPPVIPVVLRTVDNWELGLNPPVVWVIPVPNAVQAAPEAPEFVAQVPEGQFAVSETPFVAQVPEGQFISVVSDGSFGVAEAARMAALQN